MRCRGSGRAPGLGDVESASRNQSAQIFRENESIRAQVRDASSESGGSTYTETLGNPYPLSSALRLTSSLEKGATYRRRKSWVGESRGGSRHGPLDGVQHHRTHSVP